MPPLLVDGNPADWCPHETFRALREQAPVQRVVLPGGLTAWLVTGAAEARAALTDPRLAHDLRRLTDPAHGFAGRRYPDDIFAVEGRHLLNSDGADHERLRAIVAPLFSRTAALRRQPFIERLCAELLDRLPGEADLITDYARPLATRVTAEILGIDDTHLPELSRLTTAMITARDPENEAVQRDRVALFRLWARIIGDKRRAPGEDVLTELVRARDLSPQELISVAWGLFSGGISPVTTLIAAGAVELMRDPGLLRTPDLIEELLRHTSPFPVSVWRFAVEDTTIGDTVVPQGAVVLVSLAAANRDPLVFPDPDALSRGRGAHLAFGLGRHYCPGAHLARVQGTVALTSLFTRFPDLRLAVPESELRWHGVLVERCYDSVPVRTEENGRAPAAS